MFQNGLGHEWKSKMSSKESWIGNSTALHKAFMWSNTHWPCRYWASWVEGWNLPANSLAWRPSKFHLTTRGLTPICRPSCLSFSLTVGLSVETLDFSQQMSAAERRLSVKSCSIDFHPAKDNDYICFKLIQNSTSVTYKDVSSLNLPEMVGYFVFRTHAQHQTPDVQTGMPVYRQLHTKQAVYLYCLMLFWIVKLVHCMFVNGCRLLFLPLCTRAERNT